MPSGNTGWLTPAFSSIAQPFESQENCSEWVSIQNITGLNSNPASVPLIATNLSGRDMFVSRSLGWDWVIPPAAAWPDNAVVTGVEIKLYFAYRTIPLLATQQLYVKNLKVGLASIFNNQGFGASNDITHRLDDGNLIATPVAGMLMTLGGAGQMFSMPATTKMDAFFAADGMNVLGLARHSGVKLGIIGDGSMTGNYWDESGTVAFYYTELKVYWTVPVTHIDMESLTAQGVASFDTASLLRVVDMVAQPTAVASFDPASIQGDFNLASEPEAVASFPITQLMEDSEILIDLSTEAAPLLMLSEITFTTAEVRHVRQFSQTFVEVLLELTGTGFGKKKDLEVGPFEVTVTMDTIHEKAVAMSTIVDWTWVSGSMESPAIVAEHRMAAAPLVTALITAAMEGEIQISTDCDNLNLEVTAIIVADLGYAKNLVAQPTVIASIFAPNISHHLGMAAQPEAVVSILARLASKYAEPAPDDRTVYLCPYDHRIIITKAGRNI